MAVPSSGQLQLRGNIGAEVGLGSSSNVNLNHASIRGLIGKSANAQNAMSEYYGAVAQYTTGCGAYQTQYLLDQAPTYYYSYFNYNSAHSNHPASQCDNFGVLYEIPYDFFSLFLVNAAYTAATMNGYGRFACRPYSDASAYWQTISYKIGQPSAGGTDYSGYDWRNDETYGTNGLVKIGNDLNAYEICQDIYNANNSGVFEAYGFKITHRDS